MPELPARPNLEHLRKQAKTLLRQARAGDPAALARIAPHRAGTSEPDRRPAPTLSEAQRSIAREYGSPSWQHLSAIVAARALVGGASDLLGTWLRLAYGGDVTGSYDLARPLVAATLLREAGPALARHPEVALATGNGAAIQAYVQADPDRLSRPSGPLTLPPLVAVTHSQLARLEEFRPALTGAARLLLRLGADPNQAIGNRFPPASLAAPDLKNPLSALYGAAGVNRDPDLTQALLDAGADPNDGESLYHSLEQTRCTQLLLRAGARIAGTNALGRSLDMADPAALKLLLEHGADPNEPGSGAIRTWGSLLLRAIAVRCSTEHIRALLDAGADPHAQTPDGISAYALATQTGHVEAAALLATAGATISLSDEDRFVAACARADAAEARSLQARRPDLPASLPSAQLRLLPDTVAWGTSAAARVMVELGWPITARGGDWDATALNHAVLRGDAELADFLLSHGAHWSETHGYGDDVLGTLSWTSINQPVPNGDWVGCAQALRAHGLPVGVADANRPDAVVIAGRTMRFAPEVRDVLIGAEP